MKTDAGRQEAARKAEEAILAAEGVPGADPRRPRYHFRARAGWMNDPNGPIFHRGWYHLFYQANPFGELCWGEKGAVVHWGHARSRDLVHWEHLPIAIWPSTESGEEHCWSGSCVVRDDGVPMTFYTSIGPTHQPKDSAEQWAALGDNDLIAWTKHPGNPIVARKVLGGVRILDWRDPFVFREAGRWYMVTGGHRENGRGCVTLFRSTDLDHWEFAGIPLEGEEENWECPALFRLGDRWVLLYSPHAPVKYYTGRMDFENVRFDAQAKGQLDFGRFIGLYAATVMPDPNGRVILWAWMFSNNKGRGWNGCLALPRVLTLLPDGGIGQEPAPEFEALRRDRQSFAGTVTANGTRGLAVAGGCAEMRLTIRSAAGRFGIRLLDAKGVVAELVCTRDGMTVAGDAVPALDPDRAVPRELRIFVDRALFEVFVDGRVTVSRWMETDGVERFELFADDGKMELSEASLWRMEETSHRRWPAERGV